jgi:hypothetical protein
MFQNYLDASVLLLSCMTYFMTVPIAHAYVSINSRSLEIISQISQLANSIFLSQKTSQQYFQPARSAQANRLVEKRL